MLACTRFATLLHTTDGCSQLREDVPLDGRPEASDLSNTCLPGFWRGGAFARVGCGTMLTDVILEEDFEKNGEVWYDPRDLEHGNVHFRLGWSRTLNSGCALASLLLSLILLLHYI